MITQLPPFLKIIPIASVPDPTNSDPYISTSVSGPSFKIVVYCVENDLWK